MFQLAKRLLAFRELAGDVGRWIGIVGNAALEFADGVVDALARLGDFGVPLFILQLQAADFAAVAAGGRLAIGPSFNDAPDEAEAKARGPFPGFLPEHVTLVNRSETPHAEGFAQEMAQGAGLPVGQIHRLAAWLPADVFVLKEFPTQGVKLSGLAARIAHDAEHVVFREVFAVHIVRADAAAFNVGDAVIAYTIWQKTLLERLPEFGLSEGFWFIRIFLTDLKCQDLPAIGEIFNAAAGDFGLQCRKNLCQRLRISC